MSRTVIPPEALPQLRQHESIRGGLRRVLLTCLDRARKTMTDERRGEAERVHEARIALKRARAVLRLGDSCGLVWTTAGRRLLARLAGGLADVRDAAVVSETARKLGSMRKSSVTGSGVSWPTWIRRVEAKHQRLGRCRWPVLSRKACVAGLVDSVQRLRRRERATKGGVKVRRLHEWRKSVIVLREQLNVFQTLLTRRQQKYAARLHRVARKLGKAQDLALFIASEKKGRPTDACSILLARARRNRIRAIKRARRLAQGLTKDLKREFRN